jgi:pimeloyl-ACP methyl ester carboxylesterase
MIHPQRPSDARSVFAPPPAPQQASCAPCRYEATPVASASHAKSRERMSQHHAAADGSDSSTRRNWPRRHRVGLQDDLALAPLGCLRVEIGLATPDQETRIGALVALAPAGSEPTPPATIPVTLRFEWGRDVPTTYLVAADDASLPLEGMRQLYERTPAPKQMLILHRADHLHFIDDAEGMHEAFRTMPLSGPAAEIQQRMRPITELCSGEQAHLFVRGLTVAHFDATLRGRAQAQRFLDGDLTADLAERGIDASIAEP